MYAKYIAESFSVWAVWRANHTTFGGDARAKARYDSRRFSVTVAQRRRIKTLITPCGTEMVLIL